MNANEEAVRAWLEAGDRGDIDAFDRFLHPDVVVHAPLGLSTDSIEAEKAVWVEAKRAVPDIRHAVQETISDDSRIVARVVVTGTLMSAFAGIDAVGKTFQIHQAVIAHFRDGLIVEAWEIADTGDLLRQVGATDVVADSDEDEGGESACPIHDPWNVMAELDVHPFGGGDVTEEKGADD